MQKLQRFMYGRYGGDKLNIVLLVIGLILSLMGSLFAQYTVVSLIFTVLADAIYIYAIFRIFSKNIPARQREYYAFLKLWTPFVNWLKLQKRKIVEFKQYKYFKCPSCRQQLRAPRGRGNIEVTCQRCRNVFRKKT